jgi:DNA repair exonuclease SbcCD nuclease subunit
MKDFKFIHIGDVHIDSDPKFKSKVEASLNQILDYCREIKVNAVIIPGDVWHKRQSYSNSSGVPFFINYLRELSKVVDFIFITKGNHDDPGSISLLNQLEKNIYAYEYPVCLGVYDYVMDDNSEIIIDLLRNQAQNEKIDYIVSLVPYPTKSNFIFEDSIDNNNAEFIKKFEEIFELIGDRTAEYKCPKILGFHGNVSGSRLSTGQTLASQDIIVTPSTLEKAKHDYYALNHIHLRQEIKPAMIYAGGIANFNWGEVEQKSFEILDFVDGLMKIETIPFTSARPMIKVETDFIDGDFLFDSPIYDISCEYRVRITIKENERSLITDDKIQKLKEHFGEDVKIEFNIIPVERESRSEQIMHCKTLLDEVKEYATVTEQPINGTIEKKVAVLQEGVGI